MEDSDETRAGLDPSLQETLAGREAARLPQPPESPGPHRILLKPPPGAPGFPVADWDRYAFVSFLGQGGMGRVYLARDKRLGREVAIKFVKLEDARFLARFMAEARAQARVDHPHVCKVFEVGEVEGKVFIAMQHIRGLPLDVAALQLSLEQKVMVLRDAALGVHEAHRVGIIHRDLKPSNILVEQDEDGVDHAYVMDFGLAHEWEADATETGSVLGTPAFMSPEQARGEVAGLDRRADVYSLGATLYQILTGHAAVEGTNALEILSAVSSSDPKPFRALKLDIPRDLEAITLKCLEKDRARRYASAKALAEDLDRFLAGDPVQARPTGLWYRLQRRARKHKQLTAVGTAALVLVLIATGMALKARRDAGRREQLAQQFTEAMAHIESMARYSALSPPHDIRPDLQAVRGHMAELEGAMTRAGDLARGPGHYALGQGHWTLDDPEQARNHLQMAWDAGYRVPRVAYALGLALSQQYRERLLEAQTISRPAQREARLQELATTLRDPLLAFLRQARGADVPSPRYLEAQVAFAEGRLDEALAMLQTLGGLQPWFYEAPLLEGSLLQARAWERWNRGDRDGALAGFEAGRAALARAALVARSSPRVLSALGELEYNAMAMEKYGQGRMAEAFTRGEVPIRQALALQPDHVPSLVLDASLKGNFADYRAGRGEDSEAMAREAVGAAERAMAAGPLRTDARRALGFACYQLGNVQSALDRDPTAALARGLQAFEGLSEEKRDSRTWTNLGLIHQTWASFEASRGQDPAGHLGGAIAAYEHVTRLDAQALPARINLGTCLHQRATLPRAATPEADLEAAARVLEEARALNPQHFVPYFVLGKVRYEQGMRARARGEDPTAHLEAAVALSQQGSAINRQVPNLHLGIAAAQQELAREAWDRGRDPSPLLEATRQTLDRAIAVAPKLSLGHNNLADLMIFQARLRGRPADAEAAARAVRKGLALAPENRELLENLGRLQAVRVELALGTPREPRAELEAGETIFAKVMAMDPTTRTGWQYLGELRVAGALWRARHGKAVAGDFERARQAFQRSLALEPRNQETQLALGRLGWAQATWARSAGGDPGPALQEASSLAEALLKARPDWAEALALRGAIRLIRAELGPEGAREEEASRAAEDLTSALDRNPNLRAGWGEARERARSAAGLSRRP